MEFVKGKMDGMYLYSFIYWLDRDTRGYPVPAALDLYRGYMKERSPVIIAGDLNARTVDWGVETNVTGRALLEVLAFLKRHWSVTMSHLWNRMVQFMTQSLPVAI